MKLLIRFDVNPKIGYGHYVRCMSIYNQIKKISPQTEVLFCTEDTDFVQKETSLPKEQFIRKKKDSTESDFLEYLGKSYPGSLIFIDHLYSYQKEDFFRIHKNLTIVLMHNLCPAQFYCHTFILPSEHHHINELIRAHNTFKNHRFLNGGKWIVLNPNVKMIKPSGGQTSSQIRIGITTGGSDPKSVMIKLASYITNYPFDNCEFVFFPGNSFIRLDDLKALRRKSVQPFEILNFDLSALNECDLIISTFGISTYELAYLGKPVLSIGHQMSNANGSKILSTRSRGIIDLGLIDNLEYEQFKLKLDYLISKGRDFLKELGNSNRTLLDGNGDIRIAKYLLNLTNE